jgi:hypothetical protein
MRFAKEQSRLHTGKNHFPIQLGRFQPVERAATPQTNPLPQRITKFPPQKTSLAISYEISGLDAGGVLFVENVFAHPGIGTLAVQSVFNLDPPMIMGTVLFSAALMAGANWVVDWMYGWIDPRIKSGT